MPPRPDIEDHHSPLILQDLVGSGSYVDVEQSPKFKNSQKPKAPLGRIFDFSRFAPELLPPRPPPTCCLLSHQHRLSVSSQSPGKKVTQRKMDDELKVTQNQSKDAPGGTSVNRLDAPTEPGRKQPVEGSSHSPLTSS